MRALLGLPVPTPFGGRLVLVFHTGRRTGRRCRQPVSYVSLEGDLLTLGGGRWTANRKQGEPTRIRLRGRGISARPELVTDPELVESLLGVMRAASSSVGRFARLPKTPDGRYERTPLEAAIRHGFLFLCGPLAPRGGSGAFGMNPCQPPRAQGHRQQLLPGHEGVR
jgi:hypothetical protein